MNFLRSALAAGLALHLAVEAGSAAPAVSAIGTVVTTGAFRLNHATVRSNATLFEGAVIESGAAPARVDLATGTRLELQSESSGSVFGEHLVLERGAARIDKVAAFGATSRDNARFRVEVRGLTIEPDANASAGRIVVIGARRVEVAALTGSFRVINPVGMLVAKIAAGGALALEWQPTTGPARVTGRLVKRDGHFLLTDETTNVTLEVEGPPSMRPALTNALGQRMEITGSADLRATPVSGAAQLIEVAQVAPAPAPSGSAPGGSAPGGTGGAGGTAPAGTGGGGAAGTGAGGTAGAAEPVTMIAVIGGVAAAAVVGGLAATGSLGGSTAGPVSR